MKPGGSVFLFGGRRTIHRATRAMEDAGFHLRDLLCWSKPSAHFRAQSLGKLFERRGQYAEAKRWRGWRLGNLAPAFEPIAWFFKPYEIGGTIADNVLHHGVGAINTEACLQDGRAPTNVLEFDFAKGEAGVHEAQKPVALLEYLIALSTTERQLVLDPFMGSGSTGLACVNLRRRFIGIEKEREHFADAKRRILLALKQTASAR
jgi:site-specific DNA-methyltransferase (adenine-specific)